MQKVSVFVVLKMKRIPRNTFILMIEKWLRTQRQFIDTENWDNVGMGMEYFPEVVLVDCTYSEGKLEYKMLVETSDMDSYCAEAFGESSCLG